MSHHNHQFGESHARFSPRFISYDSEFVREKSYVPKLALVQLHQPDSTTVTLYDPLRDRHAPPWEKLLNHPAPIVMHSGSQDLELIYLNTAQLPTSYRDTQLGFSLLHPAKFISYVDIVVHYLSVTLAKDHTRSNWLKRPLTHEQLDYAADDVAYLSQVYPLLTADLHRLGRLTWWQEDCARMLAQATEVKKPYRWYRLSAAPQLKGIETAIADLLVNAREVLAARYDLPRRQIGKDKDIVQWAKSRPTSIETLADVMPPEHKLWQALPELTAYYEQLATLTDYPTIPRPPKLTAQAKKRYDHLLAHTQHCAEQLNIAPDTLASGKQLRYFCADPDTASPITQGWRAQFYSSVL